MTQEWWRQISPDIHQQMVQGRETSGNTTEAVDFIERYLRKPSQIIDIACGSGRHSLELSRRGHQVYSLDYTKGLLDIAQKRSDGLENPPRWISGNMLTLPFSDNTFDASLSLWQSMGYFNTDKENEKAFSEIARVTKSGGISVFELLNPIYEILSTTSKGTLDEKGKISIKIETEEGGVKTTNLDYFDEQTFRSHSQTEKTQNGEMLDQMSIDMRLYTIPELKAIFKKNGFKLDALFSSFDEKPFDITSKHAIIIAKKA